MNILVITQYYYPEQFRITDICEQLVKVGNNVTVVTAVPNYPEGEIFSGYENNNKAQEILNGVQIIRCNSRPRHKGILNLVLNYLSFVKYANKAVKTLKGDFDIVFVYELSPITMAIPAIKYKKIHKTPIYLYCMDIWPDSVCEYRQGRIMSKDNPIYLAALWISKKIYNSCDYIGIKCKEFNDYLVSVCGVESTKIKLLYEHAESTYLTVEDKLIDDGCYDFYFMGNMGYSQNCLIILQAIEKLQCKEKYMVHFVGDGSNREVLEKYVSQHNLSDKVVFHGRFALEQTIPFYEEADCCLLTLSDTSACGLTFPGKLVGYMAAGKSVIAAAGGATEDVINSANCGVCVKTNDVDGFSSFMLDAIENKEKYYELGKNGRRFFLENFTIEKFIGNLMEQLQELSCSSKKE